MEKNIKNDLAEIKNPVERLLLRVLLIAVSVLWFATNQSKNSEIKNGTMRENRIQNKYDSLLVFDALAAAERIRQNEARVKSQDSAILAFKKLQK